ncbi:MAG: hypothetical protein V3V08_10115 [Nannocystaceae bacterium]
MTTHTDALVYTASILLLCLCGACATQTDSTGDPPATDANTGSDALTGACETNVRVGGFEIEPMPDGSLTAITGRVATGVVPSNILHRVESFGPCTLWRRQSLFCDPICAPGETCDDTGECIPYPDTVDVGTVTIAGLVQPVEMAPAGDPPIYFDTTVPVPGFEEGAPLILRGGRDTPGAFTLHGWGVAKFQLLTSSVTIRRDTPIDLAWTASTLESATVHFSASVDQHGVSPLRQTCDFEDSGEASIDPTLVNALIHAGVSGSPTVRIGRRTADRVTLDAGCIDLVVTSRVSPSSAVRAAQVVFPQPSPRSRRQPRPQDSPRTQTQPRRLAQLVPTVSIRRYTSPSRPQAAHRSVTRRKCRPDHVSTKCSRT